jgi:hypothetical protein
VQKNRQTDKQTNRQTDKQTNRQTDKDDDKIHLSELYKSFKEWFYTYNPNRHVR